MRLVILLLLGVIPLFNGKRSPDVHVYLEDSSGSSLIAYQKTGYKGEVVFAFLDGGGYRLSLEFPMQKEKAKKEKRRHQTLTKTAFNHKTGTYYYQGVEGYYSVHFKKTRKIDKESFNAMFKENKSEDETLYTVANFLIKSNGGEIGIVVRDISAKQFKRATDKIGNDISMQSIPGIK